MAKKIKGWVRPAGVEVNGPGYELGSGCGWCEFNECGQPDYGDEKATLVVGDERVFTESEVRAIIERLTASDVFTDGQRQYIIHAAWGGGVSFADPA
jgi:hypothetical protein